MTNQITQKFIDLLGPITNDRAHFTKTPTEVSPIGHGIHEMSKVQVELAEDIIRDHFKVRKVLWMELPSTITEDGKHAVVAQTHRLSDDEFTGYEGKTAYVYQILFSPIMYDPKNIHDAVKDGCTIIPTVYNPETFTPYRKIVLTWSPKQTQDFPFNNSEEVPKQTLRDQLEKVLANPEQYTPEGHRVCLIRMGVK